RRQAGEGSGDCRDRSPSPPHARDACLKGFYRNCRSHRPRDRPGIRLDLPVTSIACTGRDLMSMGFKTTALAVVAALIAMAAPAKANDKVIFSLNWVPYGLHYGVFAAETQGFYRKAGIDIDIQRG